MKRASTRTPLLLAQGTSYERPRAPQSTAASARLWERSRARAIACNPAAVGNCMRTTVAVCRAAYARACAPRAPADPAAENQHAPGRDWAISEANRSADTLPPVIVTPTRRPRASDAARQQRGERAHDSYLSKQFHATRWSTPVLGGAVGHPAARVGDGDRHGRVADSLLEAEPRDVSEPSGGHRSARGRGVARNDRVRKVCASPPL
jgi:hypothetical protein